MIVGTSQAEIKIVSSKSNEIRNMILSKMDRGVTILNGRSGYMNNDLEIILSVMSNREVMKTVKQIQMIDPEAFLTITRISEVRGRGFTDNKNYIEQ